VVTADGTRGRERRGNPDLLWGLRGGGGNFGVVTSFDDRLHPGGAGGQRRRGAARVFRRPEVFRFVVEFVATAPHELAVTASTVRAPPAMPIRRMFHGELVTMLAVCWAGALSAGERALRPLHRFGPPLAD
jgi:FAD/FMN-containing dehydrogenase